MQHVRETCNWCGQDVPEEPSGQPQWLCPECEAGHQSDAVHPQIEGPKEAYDDLP